MFNGGRAPIPKGRPRVVSQAPSAPPILIPHGRSTTAPPASSYRQQSQAASYASSPHRFAPPTPPYFPGRSTALGRAATGQKPVPRHASKPGPSSTRLAAVLAAFKGGDSPWRFDPYGGGMLVPELKIPGPLQTSRAPSDFGHPLIPSDPLRMSIPHSIGVGPQGGLVFPPAGPDQGGINASAFSQHRIPNTPVLPRAAMRQLQRAQGIHREPASSKPPRLV